MLEAEDNFLTIDFKDNDFVVNMDYDKIPTSGLAAISDFLTKLHCFKATGDLARGRELFERYSAVDEIGLRL